MSDTFTVWLVWADGYGYEESQIMSAHEKKATALVAKERLERRAAKQRKAHKKWMESDASTDAPRRDLADKQAFRVHPLRVKS